MINIDPEYLLSVINQRIDATRDSNDSVEIKAGIMWELALVKLALSECLLDATEKSNGLTESKSS